jgi:hypothetical protein
MSYTHDPEPESSNDLLGLVIDSYTDAQGRWSKAAQAHLRSFLPFFPHLTRQQYFQIIDPAFEVPIIPAL